jgi:hypothetical protein
LIAADRVSVSGVDADGAPSCEGAPAVEGATATLWDALEGAEAVLATGVVAPPVAGIAVEELDWEDEVTAAGTVALPDDTAGAVELGVDGTGATPEPRPATSVADT